MDLVIISLLNDFPLKHNGQLNVTSVGGYFNLQLNERSINSFSRSLCTADGWSRDNEKKRVPSATRLNQFDTFHSHISNSKMCNIKSNLPGI